MDLNDPGPIVPPPGYLLPEGDAGAASSSALSEPSAEVMAYLQGIVNQVAAESSVLRGIVDVYYTDEVDPETDTTGTFPFAEGEAAPAEPPGAAGTRMLGQGDKPHFSLKPQHIREIQKRRRAPHAGRFATDVRKIAATETTGLLKAAADLLKGLTAEQLKGYTQSLPAGTPLWSILSAAQKLRSRGCTGRLEVALIGGLEALIPATAPASGTGIDIDYWRVFHAVFPHGIRAFATPKDPIKVSEKDVKGIVFDPTARSIRIDVGANYRVTWKQGVWADGQPTHEFAVAMSSTVRISDANSLCLLLAP